VAPHVHDPGAIRADGQLLPEPAGVGIERAGAAGRLEPPDHLEQLLLGEHSLRLGRQRCQQLELLHRQLYGHTADRDLLGKRVPRIGQQPLADGLGNLDSLEQPKHTRSGHEHLVR
jgi:hypothetical protein